MPVASVGDTARATLDVTAAAVDQFASVTGDENPLHTDEEYASEGVFGGRVAHGALTAGVVSAALARLDGDVVYLSQESTFENPVFPGETVTATVEVVDDLGDDRLRVETRAETDEPVLSGSAVVLSLVHG
ncbi:acyl dehydratase [halophilic archaeon]|nr:acyl dehydratase [halophilic archaeon]